MALINITPIMTANNKPEPYVAKASSDYGSGFEAYKLFDGTDNTKGGWRSQERSSEQKYVELDFGGLVGVSAIRIVPRTGSTLISDANPKKVKLLGYDGFGWFTVYETVDDVIVKDKEKLIEFSMTYGTKFKLEIIETQGSSNFANMSKLEFLYDEKFLDGVESVSYKNASLSYTLPMSTTEKILSKRRDTREGLLGMANDSENYGDLYVVGKDGRSHLTKAGMKSEMIWSGRAYRVNDLMEFEKPLETFKMIKISGNNGSGKQYQSLLFVDSLKWECEIPVGRIILIDGQLKLTAIDSSRDISSIIGIY